MTSFVNDGRLTFCTDIGYPPMEFYEDGKPVGADIEIGKAIADRLGLEASFVDEPVEGIIDALYGGHGDLIINAFTDNRERRERLAFVDYLSVGQTVVVLEGNPLKICRAADLAGRRVAVQADTSNEDSLRTLDADHQRDGLGPILIASYKGKTGESTRRAAAALRRGEADADFLDVVSATWHVRQNSHARQSPDVEIAPFVVNEEPYGIGFRKEDTGLQHQVLSAVRSMYRDGTMKAILEQWGLDDLAMASESQVILQR